MPCALELCQLNQSGVKYMGKQTPKNIVCVLLTLFFAATMVIAAAGASGTTDDSIQVPDTSISHPSSTATPTSDIDLSGFISDFADLLNPSDIFGIDPTAPADGNVAPADYGSVVPIEGSVASTDGSVIPTDLLTDDSVIPTDGSISDGSVVPADTTNDNIDPAIDTTVNKPKCNKPTPSHDDAVVADPVNTVTDKTPELVDTGTNTKIVTGKEDAAVSEPTDKTTTDAVVSPVVTKQVDTCKEIVKPVDNCKKTVKPVDTCTKTTKPIDPCAPKTKSSNDDC